MFEERHLYEEPCIRCDACEEAIASEWNRPFENGWVHLDGGLIVCRKCAALPNHGFPIATDTQPIAGSSLMCLAEDLPGVGVVIRLTSPALSRFQQETIAGSCSQCGRPTPANERATYRGRCENCFASSPYGVGSRIAPSYTSLRFRGD